MSIGNVGHQDANSSKTSQRAAGHNISQAKRDRIAKRVQKATVDVLKSLIEVGQLARRIGKSTGKSGVYAGKATIITLRKGLVKIHQIMIKTIDAVIRFIQKKLGSNKRIELDLQILKDAQEESRLQAEELNKEIAKTKTADILGKKETIDKAANAKLLHQIREQMFGNIEKLNNLQAEIDTASMSSEEPAKDKDRWLYPEKMLKRRHFHTMAGTNRNLDREYKQVLKAIERAEDQLIKYQEKADLLLGSKPKRVSKKSKVPSDPRAVVLAGEVIVAKTTLKAAQLAFESINLAKSPKKGSIAERRFKEKKAGALIEIKEARKNLFQLKLRHQTLFQKEQTTDENLREVTH